MPFKSTHNHNQTLRIPVRFQTKIGINRKIAYNITVSDNIFSTNWDFKTTMGKKP